MARNGNYWWLSYRGTCVRCKARFIGKGDRCPKCAVLLRERQRRKRR